MRFRRHLGIRLIRRLTGGEVEREHQDGNIGV